MELITDTMNPFSDDINQERLFNIATGKSTTEETCNFLLNINQLGHSLMENFIKECVEDAARFEKPIAKQKLKEVQASMWS